MNHVSLGQSVRVPCQVQPGPFAEEVLVTFDTMEGVVSGFIDAEEIESDTSGAKFMTAIVRDVSEETVTVWIKGSFFTTNGLASISRDQALAE